MKRIPMILLLMAPGATLAICYLADLDLTPGFLWRKRRLGYAGSF